MKQWILWLILAFAFFLEGTITTLPLVLMAFLVLMVFLKSKLLFWVALFIGFLLDVFLLRSFGITSLVLIIFLFIIYLYEGKFEISTNYFVLFFSFMGSLAYLFVLGVENAILQAVFLSLLTLIIVRLLMRSEIKKPKYKLLK